VQALIGKGLAISADSQPSTVTSSLYSKASESSPGE
jgi:hypothetical protein